MKTNAAVLNMEALRLRLIPSAHHVVELAPVGDAEEVTQDELVSHLLEGLATADKAFSTQVENLLVRIGEPVLPALMDALKTTDSLQTRSIIANVLIRLAPVSIPSVKRLARDPQLSSSLAWVVDFILEHLGEGRKPEVSTPYGMHERLRAGASVENHLLDTHVMEDLAIATAH